MHRRRDRHWLPVITLGVLLAGRDGWRRWRRCLLRSRIRAPHRPGKTSRRARRIQAEGRFPRLLPHSRSPARRASGCPCGGMDAPIAPGPADQPGDRRCNWPESARSISPRRRCRSSRHSPCSSRPRSSVIPNAQRRRRLLPARRRPAEPLHGRKFPQGPADRSSSAAGRLCRSGSPTRSSTRWRRGGWSPRGRPTFRPRGTTSCSRSRRRSSTSRRRAGRLLGRRARRSSRAELLVNFAKGLAPSLIAPLEINRAQAELQSLRQTQQVAIRDWRVASAQLAEILLLDPATLLEPVEPPFLQVTLIPCDQSPEELVPVALNNRPEIASRRELVAAAEQLLRREKNRPFLPNLFVTQPGDDDRSARGRQPLLRPQRAAEQQRLAARHRGRRGLAAAERRASATSAGSASSEPSSDLASIEFTRTVFRVKSEVAQARRPAADRPGARGRDRRGCAPGDRIGRQELHRPARDDPAGRRAARA